MASSAPAAMADGPPTDNVIQTLGSATLYGTSTPVSVGAVATHAAAVSALSAALRHHDSHVIPTLMPYGPRAVHAARADLQPPSPPEIPVDANPGDATGFNGLSQADQRLAGTGAYADSQFSVEPPDQGMCVGRGLIVEPINDALRVFDEHGNALTGVTPLSQFYQLVPPINRTTGVLGDFISDPKCYFDPFGQRFIQTLLEVDAPGNFNGQAPFNRTHVLVAVSQTSDPTGAWNLYSIDASDDGLNGTPAHPGCPCLPDQPLLGANADGVFITITEFQDNSNFFFNGDQIFAFGRSTLERGTSGARFVHLDLDAVPTGDPNMPKWGSIQPSTSPDPGFGTELLMSGGPEDIFQNTATLDNRIAVWSLSGTWTLNFSNPFLTVRHIVLTSETYGVPPNVGATQKAGPTPLRDSLGDVDPLETINSNDGRMNQVVYVDGVLYGGVNTTVIPATGPSRIGIAYFAVAAEAGWNGLHAEIANQGYVVPAGENALYPSIAVDRYGAGVIAFTLTGPDFFPSAAYVRLHDGHTFGHIHISGAGVLPDDGFTGYQAFGSTTGVARWGDYSAAVLADGSFWLGNEYIPGTPRTQLANWGTFLTRIRSDY